MAEYEEYKVPSQLVGWVLLISLCVALLGYGMWLMLTIPDVPRTWNYGALPDTPAESAYSTVEPSPVQTGRKLLQPLPEGREVEKERKELYDRNREERSGHGLWR